MIKKILSLSVLVLASGSALAEESPSAPVAQTNAVVQTNAVKKATRPARITSATTYYDRKEGVAIFTGKVFVDDDQYKLHADKAYVFMSGTNDLERIVALGNIALTNENKRAYGAKVTYYRNRGMVVLHSGDGQPAEVREVKPDGDQIVRGKKIKFWIDSEQVEVVESVIDASTNLGRDSIKSFR